jgi:hypothetical protein
MAANTGWIKRLRGSLAASEPMRSLPDLGEAVGIDKGETLIVTIAQALESLF